MKARTLVFMLGISLMCFTGFGNTTADPTENSSTELVHLDDSVSVVSVEIEVNRFDASFAEADTVFDDLHQPELKNLSVSPGIVELHQSLKADLKLPEPDAIEGDVGWRNRSEFKI